MPLLSQTKLKKILINLKTYYKTKTIKFQLKSRQIRIYKKHNYRIIILK